MGDDVRSDILAAQAFAQNKAYLKPDATSFATTLPPEQEAAFQAYIADKSDPTDLGRNVDNTYDMRGWFQGMQAGDPRAALVVNPNDGLKHRDDWWKTPYHPSFSVDSQWADPTKAPKWNEQDQLVLPNGSIVFDERKK